jgi:hypothetical protein
MRPPPGPAIKASDHASKGNSGLRLRCGRGRLKGRPLSSYGGGSISHSVALSYRFRVSMPVAEFPRALFCGHVSDEKQMAWVIHYRDEINNRDVTSSEISTRQAAMDQACSSLQDPGRAVSHIAGPNNQRIETAEIRKWCSGQQ